MIRSLLSEGVTLLFLERKELAVQLEEICKRTGLQAGKDFSVILLENQWFKSDIEWTCWTDESVALGMLAVNLLLDVISGKADSSECRYVEPEVQLGGTLINQKKPFIP